MGTRTNAARLNIGDPSREFFASQGDGTLGETKVPRLRQDRSVQHVSGRTPVRNRRADVEFVVGIAALELGLVPVVVALRMSNHDWDEATGNSTRDFRVTSKIMGLTIALGSKVEWVLV